MAIREITTKGDVRFKKGKISYTNGGSRGYLSELHVYGLDTSEEYAFIIIKTTSEGDVYDIVSKSNIAYN